MTPIRLALLWHQHQPQYKDQASGKYLLPWVRLHAIKDYYGMARIAQMVPGFKHQINLVPSLVEQIQDYANGTATDDWLDHFALPAASLTDDQKRFILDHFFMAQWENMIRKYPRYNELLEKRRFGRQSAAQSASLFTESDFRDLQIWSILCWFHETARSDYPDVQSLFDKGRDFTEADKTKLMKLQTAVIRSVLPMHRELQERGVIELTSTPYYHPILPLLCDMTSATVAMPWCPMPSGSTPLPDDATAHVVKALERHTQIFGRAPTGFWPAEGSLSDDALNILAKNGVRWAATDEEILERTLTRAGRRFTAAEKCQIWRRETPSGPMTLLFRDHEISDIIGFKYFTWKPDDAARDLVSRIKAAGAAARAQGNPAPVVSVILDGENCWEHYANNGTEFLLAFYRLIADSSEIRPVLGAELVNDGNVASLPTLFPGSWINHDFYIWIGHPDDRKAWEYIFRVREDLLRFEETKTDADAELFARVWDELYAAEGSDWFWWYGDDRTSGNDEIFDRLFRTHLLNIYKLLGKRAPLFLDVPVISTERLGRFDMPRGLLKVKIDGRRTNYFEWMGSGRYDVSRTGGVMADSDKPLIAEIHWGVDTKFFFLRLDLDDSYRKTLSSLKSPITIKIRFVSPKPERVICLKIGAGLTAGRSFPLETEDGAPIIDSDAMIDEIIEAALPIASLGYKPGESVEFAVETLIGDAPASILPKQCLLAWTAPGDDYADVDWW